MKFIHQFYRFQWRYSINMQSKTLGRVLFSMCPLSSNPYTGKQAFGTEVITIWICVYAIYNLLDVYLRKKEGCNAWSASLKYKIGHAIVSNVLREHSCSRTEIQSSLILAVKTLMADLKLSLPYQVNQKNAEIGGKKCRICQNKLLELLLYPNQK